MPKKSILKKKKTPTRSRPSGERASIPEKKNRACSICSHPFTLEAHEFTCPACGSESAGYDLETQIHASKLRIDVYTVLRRAVEEGIDVGYRRAHKHSDNPSENHLKEQIETGIMNEICEVFKFED